MAKNDPPSSTVAYITLITRVFWSFLGRVIIFIKKCDHVFFDESSTFIKKGTGDDFRLMTRVLPRPLVLQGGKSSRNTPVIRIKSKKKTQNNLLLILILLYFVMTCPPVKLGSRQDPRHDPPWPPPWPPPPPPQTAPGLHQPPKS